MANKIELDWTLMESLMRFKPSLSDTAELMETSEDTIANRIRETYDLTFSEYRAKKMAKVRRSLVQKALDMAINGGHATMLIFCLKNLCGWTDNQDIAINKDSAPIKIVFEQINSITDEDDVLNPPNQNLPMDD
jgi:hypothetical protein